MRKAKITLTLASNRIPMSRLAEIINIHPYETFSKFPPQSIAKPWWETETVSYGPSIVEPLLELKERVSPALDRIVEVCGEYEIDSAIVIRIDSDYGKRPEMVIPADYMPFIARLNAEVVFDIEAAYDRRAYK